MLIFEHVLLHWYGTYFYFYGAESPPILVPCPPSAAPPPHYPFLVSLSRVNLCKYKQIQIHIFLFLSPFYVKGSMLYTLPYTWLFSLNLPSEFFQSYIGGSFIFCSAADYSSTWMPVYLACHLLMGILAILQLSDHAQMSLHTYGGLIALMTPSLNFFLYPCPLTLRFAASLMKEAQCIFLTLKCGLHHVTCLTDLM